MWSLFYEGARNCWLIDTVTLCLNNFPYSCWWPCWWFRNPNHHLWCKQPVVKNGRWTTNPNWWTQDFWNINSILLPRKLTWNPKLASPAHLIFLRQVESRLYLSEFNKSAEETSREPSCIIWILCVYINICIYIYDKRWNCPPAPRMQSSPPGWHSIVSRESQPKPSFVTV